jgi:hypothetical protein
MPTMYRRLSNAEITSINNSRLAEVEAAALRIRQRELQRGQLDAAAAARAKVEDDARLSGLPTGRLWVGMVAAIVLITVVISEIAARGWF